LCDLQEVDFTQADLTLCDFDGSNLQLALFEKTNLEKANFSTANYFQIDPSTNRVKKAKFSLVGLPGLLSQFDLVIK
jgi:uncharacterized protein YjbI with pentapeptide repeats